MPDHPQISLTYEGKPVDIDEEMAPLLIELWKRGYTTEYSCQGDPVDQCGGTEAYLSFPHLIDAIAFLQKVQASIGWADYYLHAGRYTMHLSNRGGAVIRFGNDLLPITHAAFAEQDLSVYLGEYEVRKAKELALRGGQ